MSTFKSHIPSIWNENIFNKNATIYKTLKNDLNRVADGSDFNPTVDLDINTHEINNIITSADIPTSAVNVEYFNEKLVELDIDNKIAIVEDSISDIRKLTVVKSLNDFVVDDSAAQKYVEFSEVLLDNRVTKLDDADKTTIEFLEDGLYKVDFSAEINGVYKNGFVEFIVLDDGGTETTFRHLNLSESHVDSEVLHFSLLNKLKIKATVDVTGEEYTGKIKLIIEKLY